MSFKSKVLNSNFLKQIIYFVVYYLLIWVIYLLLVSIVAFFHFILDHHLSEVEDWLFFHRWDLIIITKILALFVILKFVNLKNNSRRPLRSLLLSGRQFFPKESFVIIAFLLLFTFVIGYPLEMQEKRIGISRLIVSFSGILVFYLSDMLLILALRNEHPLSSTVQRVVRMLFFPFVLLMVSKSIFLFEKSINWMVFFHLMICIYFSEYRSNNWTFPALYLLLFVCPTSVFLGLDPVWGSFFSPFNLKYSLLKTILLPKELIFVTLLFISMGYLLITEKNRSV